MVVNHGLLYLGPLLTDESVFSVIRVPIMALLLHLCIPQQLIFGVWTLARYLDVESNLREWSLGMKVPQWTYSRLS